MLRFELPEPAIDRGPKLAVAPAGKPLAVNTTVPLKELSGEMVVAKLVPHPADRVCVAGVAATAKLGAGGVTVKLTVAVCASPPDVAEIVIG